MVSSVIDLLLRTLFNIEAATVVTLSVESCPFVFTVIQYKVESKLLSGPYPLLCQSLLPLVGCLCAVFTLKAAQPLGPSPYSLSHQLGLGVPCTLFLQDMFIPTTVLSLKLLAYPTWPLHPLVRCVWCTPSSLFTVMCAIEV